MQARHALRAAIGKILLLEIEELLTRQRHLNRAGFHVAIVAQYGAVQLNRVIQPLLNQHAAVILKRQFKAVHQPFAVIRTADTDRRAEVRGLDEHRIAQFLLHLVQHGVFVLLIHGAREPAIRQTRQRPRAAEELLHHDFVHADGAACHARGRVRQIRQFQHSLQRAVLAVQPMHDDNANFQPRYHDLRWMREQPLAGTVRQQRARTRRHVQRNGFDARFVRVKGRVRLDAAERISRIPDAVFADIHRDDVVLLAVHMVHQLHRADDGHLALTAAGTENHTKLNLCHNKNLLAFTESLIGSSELPYVSE